MLMETTNATTSPRRCLSSKDLSVPVPLARVGAVGLLVAFAAMVPVSGWLANRMARRARFFRCSNGRVARSDQRYCSMQSTLAGLVLSRAVRAGGTMMVPVGQLVVACW